MMRPANPHQVRAWKRLCAMRDAAQGRPAGPVHPAQGPPCDPIYACQYMVCRFAAMTEEERQALAEAEAEFAEADAERAEAERKMAEAREKIERLVAPDRKETLPKMSNSIRA